MSYNQLANSGRFGDTQIREVNGEPSHVNDIEAHWIDNMGPLGQIVAESMGSGTRNPNTGMKEYFWPQLIGAGLQLGGNLYDAYNNDEDSSNLEANMKDWRQNTDGLSNIASGLMNRESSLNQDQAYSLKKTAADNLAQQNMLTNRNMAQGDMGGYSGIRAAQNRANLSRMGESNNVALQNMYAANFNRGLGLKQDIGQDYKQFGEMQTNRDIANMQPGIGSMIGQFGGGLFDLMGSEVDAAKLAEYEKWKAKQAENV